MLVYWAITSCQVDVAEVSCMSDVYQEGPTRQLPMSLRIKRPCHDANFTNIMDLRKHQVMIAKFYSSGRCWIQRFFSFYVQKMSVVDDLKFLTYFCIVSINLGFDSFEIKSEQDRPYSIYRRQAIMTFVSLSHKYNT